MKIGSRLGFGFFLIFLFLFSLILFSINRMNLLSEQTERMYNHPLSVSNAVLRINADIIKIHRSMKDIALAEDTTLIEADSIIVDTLEKEVYSDFEIINERFLGENAKYIIALNLFKQWKPIRDEVIALMLARHKRKAADITRGKGADHVVKIEIAMETLGNFAGQKAIEFRDTAGFTRDRAFNTIYLLLLLSIVSCVSVALYILRSITRPMEVVKNATSRIGEGDLDTVINIDSDDEINELADSINKMSENLKRITASRDELNDEIETRKQVEQALIQSSEKLAEQFAELINIYNSSPLGLCLVDKDLRYVRINEALANMNGKSVAEHVGRTIREIVPEIADNVEKPFLNAMQTGEPQLNIEIRGATPAEPDVVHNWILGCYPVKTNDDKLLGIAAVVQNVTEIRTAEKELMEERKFTDTAIDTQIDTFFLFDPNTGQAIRWNKQFRDISGYSDEEIANMKAPDSYYSPEDLKNTAATINNVMTSGSGKAELDLICKDGKRIPFEYVVSTVKDDANNVRYFISIGRDITARKQAEEILNNTLDELARSNAELENFAYVASHDLKEPLRSISGFTDLIVRRYKGKLDKDADDFFGFITDGTNRMGQLIDDLLAYSRISTAKKEYTLVDLNIVLKKVIATLSLDIKKTKAEICIDELPSVSSNSIQMEQLFQNLISNAIKFSKDEILQIKVSAAKEQNEWVFSVSDNGIGISHEHNHKIFDMFQRLHPRSTYEGTGIGLAICKKIVDLHGGKIWVESESGKGSTFYFTLPA